MKEYNEFKSKSDKDIYLYSYLILQSEFYEKFLIFPDGCDYIILSNKGYFEILNKSNRLQSIEIDNEELFILRLKPYTLKLLLDKKYILQSVIVDLIPKIFKTKSILQRAEVIDVIFEEINFNKYQYKLIECINSINEQRGNIKIEELAKQQNSPVRNIQRLFKNHLEFSPKEYTNIIKLQSDISTMKKIKYHKSYNVPSHYYDYSHFFKTFKKYTSLSPNRFYDTYLKHVRSIYDIY